MTNQKLRGQLGFPECYQLKPKNNSGLFFMSTAGSSHLFMLRHAIEFKLGYSVYFKASVKVPATYYINNGEVQKKCFAYIHTVTKK